MTTPPSHEHAEHAMRRYLEQHDLPQPDEVLRDEGELVLLWHDQQLAVILELVPPAQKSSVAGSPA
jgi:hypothetical protein